MARGDARSILRAEDLQESVENLATDFRAMVNDHRRRFGVEEDYAPSEEVEALLERGLRFALRSDVVPAQQAEQGRINQQEFDHEIMKRALVDLTRAPLTLLAKEQRVSVGGSSEAVATRVAESLGWNAEAIAEAVLRFENVTTTERGHSTRVFVMSGDPDMDYVRERLQYVEGRYVKLGLAKWFVFESVEKDVNRVELVGALRTFKADVEPNDAGEAEIHHVGDRKNAVVEARDDGILRVHGAVSTVARAAAQAFMLAANIDLRAKVPRADIDAGDGGAPLELHQTSEFLLDIVHNRLAARSLADVNLTSAKFKVGSVAAEDGEDERRPILRSIKLDGSYIIGSQAACEMLHIARRPLVDVNLTMKVRAADGVSRGRIPVRIAIEDEHVLVATGYGTGDLEVSEEVHNFVVSAIVREIREGFGNDSRLRDLIGEIARVASAGESTTVSLGGVK